MLCVSLAPATLDDIFNSDIRFAECVEVRLDYLKDPHQSQEVSWRRLQLPVIVTCPRIDRGGRFKGTLEEERAILQFAARNGAAFVDMDYRDAIPMSGAQLIGSFNDSEHTPNDVHHHLDSACNNPAIHIGKVATAVQSWSDNRRLLELLAKRWSKPVIVLGTGEMGEITRLVGAARGSYLTYAGPLTADQLIHGYRYRRIQHATKLFGVVGNPVTQSRGYLMHNRAFEAAGLDFAYLKFPVVDVRDFFEHASAIGIAGFSVTMPHKAAVIPFLSQLSEAAQEAGAVNTVSSADGRWVGDNTDVYGARIALSSADFDPKGKRVLILGAGGAAKAAAVAVKEAQSVVMLRRTELKNAAQYDCDLLINATPVGMAPNVDASPVTGRLPGQVVFDMVYTPAETTLLHLAREQGRVVIPGTEMFYAQAARQFEIWTGRAAPAGLYRPQGVS